MTIKKEAPLCPLCGKQENRIDISFERNCLRHCMFCDLFFTYPMPPIDSEFYNQDYYKSWGVAENSIPKHVLYLKERNMQKHLDRIKEFVSSGMILEIGSAWGAFLKVAEEAGYDILGLELSKQACRFARTIVKEDAVLNQSLEETNLSPESVDVIFMSDLLEHIPNPFPFIEKSVSLLKKGGIIYLITPNPSHWSRGVFGKSWVHYKDEHLMFFTGQTFSWISERLNLKIVEQSNHYKFINFKYLDAQLNNFGYNYFGFLLSSLNSLLPDKLKEFLFPIPIGESIVIVQKN